MKFDELKLRWKLCLIALGAIFMSWIMMTDDARIRHDEEIKQLKQNWNNYLGE